MGFHLNLLQLEVTLGGLELSRWYATLEELVKLSVCPALKLTRGQRMLKMFDSPLA